MRLTPRPIRIFTFLTDIAFINLAFYVAHLLRYELRWFRPVLVYHPFGDYAQQQLLLNGFLLFTFWQYRLWRRRRGELFTDELGRLANAIATAMAVMVIYIFLMQPTPFSRLFWVWVPAVLFVLLGLGRALRRLTLSILYSRGLGVDHVLIIGTGETGRSVMRTIMARPDLGFKPIGYLDQGNQDDLMGVSRKIPHLGAFDDLPKILQTNPHLYTVFIALPAHMHQDVMRLIRICRQHDIPVQVAPDMFQLSLSQVESTNMAGIPVLGVRKVRISPLGRVAKRMLDLGLLAVGAVPALVCGVVIAAAIKLDSSGPIFYVAERIGHNGRPFSMIKFRSMVVNAADQKEALKQMNEAEGPIFKIREDPRLTRVGRVIRRLSLDELPQLINVLRGEMSFVGPRPPLAEEVRHYQSWHKQRLAVRGGITGLWQVSGRSDLTFDEQCLLDIYYIENWSLSMDIRILLQTVPYALFGRGAY